MRDEWTSAEKKIAQRAFEAARVAVLAEAFAAFKAKAAAASTIDEMWDLVNEFRQRRRDMEELLDYRYSVLTLTFARLVVGGYLDEEQLKDLSEDKLAEIRRDVSFLQSR
jgi:flagellar biosynthesis/type III secretory pathway protein FliH